MPLSNSTSRTKHPPEESPDSRPVLSRAELLARAQRWDRILLDGPITYFPIRHHSPACAAHLSRWIHEVRPDSIIIEGPRSLDQWLSSLLSDECVGPVAILTTYRESDSPEALRHSAFYPMCDYSPEWAAVREGSNIGARVKFADLEFGDKVRVQQQFVAEDDRESMLGVLLADESQLRYSAFIEKLVRRMGCRDFDELWDHLFESRADQLSTAEFVGQLATYCDLSRASHSDEFLKSDATLAREAVMVEVVRAEYRRLKKPQRTGAVLVVTGGFHTVALPEAVAGKGNPNLATLEPPDESLVGSWLIRYSYDQLDALSGYRSGMPSPGFYDAIWQCSKNRTDARSAIAGLISNIARATRGQAIPHEASVTDSIASLQMLDRLADLRGHHSPTRSDLLDAINSCMRKESGSADMLTSITRRILAGDRIGRIPASAGQPPVVDDFHRLASTYRLPVNSIEPAGVNLELYRNPARRPISFLLHQLCLLDVPYATFVDGPDFIHGHRLEKLREEWSVAWSPGTEACLSELAWMGESVAAAAAFRIRQSVDQLEEDGAARSAVAAVDLLIKACRCGLHPHSACMMSVVESQIAEDSVFASVAAALSRLMLLQSAREPLEAGRLPRINDVIGGCFQRAIHLVDSLSAVPDDQLDASLDGLLSIREILTSQSIDTMEHTESQPESESASESGTELLDASMFYDAIDRLIQDTGTPARSEVAGAAAGLLHGSGYIDEDRVCAIVQRYLNAAVEDISDACGVVRGLMMTAREAFWRMDELLTKIDALFESWEENRFNNALPHLRLAFSQLSPGEVDLVAGRIAGLYDVDEIGGLINPDFTEDEMQFAVRITERMNQSLQKDGLL